MQFILHQEALSPAIHVPSSSLDLALNVPKLNELLLEPPVFFLMMYKSCASAHTCQVSILSHFPQIWLIGLREKRVCCSFTIAILLGNAYKALPNIPLQSYSFTLFSLSKLSSFITAE